MLYTIKKKPVFFTVNKPTRFTLSPGEHFVIDVYFDKGREGWELSFLKKKPQGEFRLRMRAVYEIISDKESKNHKI